MRVHSDALAGLAQESWLSCVLRPQSVKPNQIQINVVGRVVDYNIKQSEVAAPFSHVGIINRMALAL